MVHLDSFSKMNFFEKPYAPLYGAAVRTNSHMISCAWRFFRRYKKKGWKILLIMFMQNFPEDKWSACFMFHLKTKISNDPSSDSADPAFISPEKKKQGHILPISVPHPSATCKYVLKCHLNRQRGCRLCTLRPVQEQIACFWRSVGGERVKLYAASTKGKRG